jgi:tetratricopeptide (TPR) repeat protein
MPPGRDSRDTSPSSGLPSRERAPTPSPAPTAPSSRPRLPAPTPTPAPSSGSRTRPTAPSRTAPTTPSPSRPSAPDAPARTGPSAGRTGRTPLAPGAARTIPERTETPSAGARPIDRDSILERYGRGERKPGETTRPAAPKDPSSDAPTAPPRGDDAVKSARDAYRAEQAAKDATRRKNAVETKARGEAEAKARADAEAERVRSARTKFRSEESARNIKERRDDFRAEQIRNERDLYRADQARKQTERAARAAEERTRVVRDAYEGNPLATPQRWSRGRSVSSCHGWGLSVGFGLGLGWCNPYGWSWANNCWPNWYWNGWSGCNNYWYWWGLGGYSYSWLCHPFSWSYRWNYGYWPNYRTWWPSAWVTTAWAPPVYYASVYDSPSQVVIYDSDDASEVVVRGGTVEVRQGGSQPVAVGESVQYEPQPAKTIDPTVAGVLGGNGPDTAMRMVQQYLASGDAAFRESRYGDAAHHYAKAIELKPDEGVLYLVLSDALLATGDYHYGAFALRRAFELDPALAQSDLDKREFYRDPREFDEHMLLLERFLAERPTDVDARLLLATNYLFSQRPDLAVDLLESGSSAELRAESAGQRVLGAAKAALEAR